LRGVRRALLTVAVILGLVLVGVMLGLLAARFLFVGSSLSLLVWAAVAVGVGVVAPSIRVALGGGAILGFTTVWSFIGFGYHGARPIAEEAVPFTLIAVLGAIGAAVVALLACFIRTRVQQSRRRQSALR
jgi:hypothetical protein